MSRSPQIGVLALQGDVANHERLLRHCCAATRRVRLPDELGGLDGLVIPGGESTAMWRLAVDFDLLAPVRGCIDDGLPMLGACAGMIMLADRIMDGRPDQLPFGGLDITVRRNAFGRQISSFEADVVMPALGSQAYPGVFIRAPWVESCGGGVEVLGSVATVGGPDRIVAVRQGAILATSFHPELTDDARLHRLFVDMARQ